MGISSLPGVTSFNGRKNAVTLTLADTSPLAFPLDAGVNGVGCVQFGFDISSVNPASGATIAGASLRATNGSAASMLATDGGGAALPGTWRNVSSYALSAAYPYGYFQRIA